MRFRDFIEFQEAKFTPHAHAAPVRGMDEAIQIANSILRRLFTGAQITSGFRGIEITTQDRFLQLHASMLTLGARPFDRYERREIPELEVNFSWHGPGRPAVAGDASTRDSDDYDGQIVGTRKHVSPDTLGFSHKFRDFLRKLSEYEIAIAYIAMGERREEWYASVMRSAGYKELLHSVWLPLAAMEKVKYNNAI